MKRRNYFKSIMGIIFTPVKCIFKRTPAGNIALAYMIAKMSEMQLLTIAAQPIRKDGNYEQAKKQKARAICECITNTTEGITRALNGDIKT